MLVFFSHSREADVGSIRASDHLKGHENDLAHAQQNLRCDVLMLAQNGTLNGSPLVKAKMKLSEDSYHPLGNGTLNIVIIQIYRERREYEHFFQCCL